MNQKRIYIDTETKDPNLISMGPGFIRGDASMTGFSVAVDNGDAWFFPLFYPEDNYRDPSAALHWLKDLCATQSDKVFHNAAYDIEVLDSRGITPEGMWHDTMVIEALLEETQSTSLDATARRRVGKTKDETDLNEAAASYGLDPKSEMYLLPARYVGRYGEEDAALLPQILSEQHKLTSAYGLERVLNLESRLLKATWAMRKQGVRVDLDRAAALREQWNQHIARLRAKLREVTKFDVDIWGSKSLQMLCESLHIPIARTAKGNPSFTNEWLDAHPHPALQIISEMRQYDKMCRDFIEGMIFKYEVNGRIHGQFHTTRRDEGGTRSGRFSSSNPNLQQVPARHPVFGPAIRELYLPDDGASWTKLDYSSQEPRITLHLANLAGISGAREFVERYQRDPKFCQHDYASDVLHVGRSACKGINLGLTYGMGIWKLAAQLGVDEPTARLLRDDYKQALPFVHGIADHYTSLADRQGYVETVLGRRSWFRDADAAFTYKALNRAVQGSGADLMKMAIVLVYEEMGIAPLLTVHDETDYNTYEEEHAYEMAGIMEHAIEMTVPQVVEPECGPSWGECA